MPATTGIEYPPQILAAITFGAGTSRVARHAGAGSNAGAMPGGRTSPVIRCIMSRMPA